VNTINNATRPPSGVNPETKKNIAAAVKEFLVTWHDTGLAGVQSFISNCTTDFEHDLVYCLTFDSVASAIIPYYEEQKNYPKTPQFQPAAYQARARQTLKTAGISDYQEQTNIIAGIESEASLALEVLSASNYKPE
jgi:hypothetical protein